VKRIRGDVEVYAVNWALGIYGVSGATDPEKFTKEPGFFILSNLR